MVVAAQKRILLVEPDDMLASSYKSALEKSGCRVHRVSSAQAALHYVNKQVPDIVIIELYIHDHNGVELMYELQSYEDTAAVPVVLLTYASKNQLGKHREEWSELSVVDYCYKPKTTTKDLVDVINSISVSGHHE